MVFLLLLLFYVRSRAHTDTRGALCCSAFAYAFIAWDFSITNTQAHTNTPANARAHKHCSNSKKHQEPVCCLASNCWNGCLLFTILSNSFQLYSLFATLFPLCLYFPEPQKWRLHFVWFCSCVESDGWCPRFHHFAFMRTNRIVYIFVCSTTFIQIYFN